FGARCRKCLGIASGIGMRETSHRYPWRAGVPAEGSNFEAIEPRFGGGEVEPEHAAASLQHRQAMLDGASKHQHVVRVGHGESTLSPFEWWNVQARVDLAVPLDAETVQAQHLAGFVTDLERVSVAERTVGQKQAFTCERALGVLTVKKDAASHVTELVLDRGE